MWQPCVYTEWEDEHPLRGWVVCATCCPLEARPVHTHWIELADDADQRERETAHQLVRLLAFQAGESRHG